MTDDLQFAELRVLDAVDREGSFSAAAIRLGLTQSAVSHAVRTAERKIGAVLFDRGRHGARPTAAGQRAVVHARGILRLSHVLSVDARLAAGTQVETTVRISAFRSAAAHILPTALARLKNSCREVAAEVSIVRDLGEGPAGEVAAGRSDVAIVNLPHHLNGEPELVTGELFTERFVLIHPKGREELDRLALINWDENCDAVTGKWFRSQDWLPEPSIQVADDSVLLSMVAHGMGMAVVPRLVTLSAPDSVAVRELGPEGPQQTIGYVTTPELARGIVVRTLIRELRTVRYIGILCAATVPISYWIWDGGINAPRVHPDAQSIGWSGHLGTNRGDTALTEHRHLRAVVRGDRRRRATLLAQSHGRRQRLHVLQGRQPGSGAGGP
ncbi:LysR family transcriptional regulator [Stackebrandtia nassauensis]|uniref:LysR family transcriptional regulator n=1 Tax=Stackebrandtia nassauensis TaxID=283811 RepID=UPI0001A39EC9|nr:LysR family transcriptional regulator [Stackebrandtia nassauensis]